MSYIKRAACILLAAGMLAASAGCQKGGSDDKKNKDTTDAPVQSAAHVGTVDTPTTAENVPTYKIGKVTFRQDTTELQLGDVTFTEADLNFISTCTKLQYFGVLSSNLSDLNFLEDMTDIRIHFRESNSQSFGHSDDSRKVLGPGTMTIFL